MDQISETYVDLAIQLKNQGNLHGAWTALSQGGDVYASAASDIISDDQGLLGHVVNNYWDRVFGEGVREEKWFAVGNRHFDNYVSEIKRVGDTSSVDDIFNLPSSSFIEGSYASALEFNGLNRNGAIDLALNQVSYPITIPIGDIDSPDWHQTLSLLYGDFGNRSHYNSGTFTTLSYEENLYNLGIAGAQGTFDWIKNETLDLPEEIQDSFDNIINTKIPSIIDDYGWLFNEAGNYVSNRTADWISGILDESDTSDYTI